MSTSKYCKCNLKSSKREGGDEAKDGRWFNQFCTCHSWSCVGVKPCSTGKLKVQTNKCYQCNVNQYNFYVSGCNCVSFNGKVWSWF